MFVDMFFFFLIILSICSVLLTMLVLRLELKAERKPFQEMSRWVSRICRKKSQANFSTLFENA